MERALALFVGAIAGAVLMCVLRPDPEETRPRVDVNIERDRDLDQIRHLQEQLRDVWARNDRLNFELRHARD